VTRRSILLHADSKKSIHAEITQAQWMFSATLCTNSINHTTFKLFVL
jgi:hypothetical protein